MRAHGQSESGFSLIELLIAMTVLTAGMLSLAGVLALGLYRASGSTAALIAREKAREAVESVHTARDAGTLAWNSVFNEDDSEDGVFLDDEQDLLTPGEDGLVNTADDGGENKDFETIRMPGKDGALGTNDDVIMPLKEFKRTIKIVPVKLDGGNDPNQNLREITVTVKYKVQNAWRTYTLKTYVSSFS